MATTTSPATDAAGFDLSRALAAYLDRFSRAAIATALAAPSASRTSKPPADAPKPA